MGRHGSKELLEAARAFDELSGEILRVASVWRLEPANAEVVVWAARIASYSAWWSQRLRTGVRTRAR